MTSPATETQTRERRIVTTDELRELIAAGKTVRLPAVQRPSHEILAHYDEHDVARLTLKAEDNPVVAVRYVGEQPVQCISVEHERHLYLTDDMIPTHNTGNIVFLKSTDDEMIEKLSKMSGTTHNVYKDSKTITQDMNKVGFKTEGKVSYTMTDKEEQVISYNQLAYLQPKNSIVFPASRPPVWNRNEMILPMSFRLFKNTIQHFGHKYSLETIPTLSSALEFDVRLNQPDFVKMLNHRMKQATHVDTAEAMFREAYGYDDYQMSLLDPDVLSSDIMDVVDRVIEREAYLNGSDGSDDEATAEHEQMIAEMGDLPDPPQLPAMNDAVFASYEDDDAGANMLLADATDNDELAAEVAELSEAEAEDAALNYAGGRVSKSMLVTGGRVVHNLDREIIAAYRECRNAIDMDSGLVVDETGQLFDVRPLSDRGAGGHFETHSSGSERTLLVEVRDESADLAKLQAASQDADSRVYVDEADADVADAFGDEINGMRVTDDFIRMLYREDDWTFIADGYFESELGRAMSAAEN